MSTLEVYAGSIQYARWPVTVTDETGASVNPTSDPVQIAFQPVRSTAALTWQTAAWVTDTAPTPDTYYARVLLGTGVFALSAGVFDVYLRITDSSETPILSAGTLYVQ